MPTDTIDYNQEPEKQPRPYVEFEMRPRESRDASGKPVFIDVPWAKVTSQGSRDTLEKVAEDWIAGLEEHAKAGRIPRIWPSQYREALAAFVKGEEVPLQGTAIRNWPVPTKSQRRSLEDAHVYTVEDLALANDEVKARLGMGAEHLIQVAQAYIKDIQGPGALAVRLDAVLAENEAKDDRIRKLEADVQALMAAMPRDQVPAPPDRPTGVLKLEV